MIHHANCFCYDLGVTAVQGNDNLGVIITGS